MVNPTKPINYLLFSLQNQFVNNIHQFFVTLISFSVFIFTLQHFSFPLFDFHFIFFTFNFAIYVFCNICFHLINNGFTERSLLITNKFKFNFLNLHDKNYIFLFWKSIQNNSQNYSTYVGFWLLVMLRATQFICCLYF